MQSLIEQSGDYALSVILRTMVDFGFHDLEGSYEIISVQRQKCSYEDFQKRESTFITASDLAKEKMIDYQPSYIDVRGEILMVSS